MKTKRQPSVAPSVNNRSESFAILNVLVNKKIKSSVRKALLAEADQQTVKLLRTILYNLVRNTLKYKSNVLRTKFGPYRNTILQFIDVKKRLSEKKRKSLFLDHSIGWQFINNLLGGILNRFKQVFKDTLNSAAH